MRLAALYAVRGKNVTKISGPNKGRRPRLPVPFDNRGRLCIFHPVRSLKWRNWQTRWTQNPVRLTPGVGSTPTFSTMTKILTRGHTTLLFIVLVSGILFHKFLFSNFQFRFNQDNRKKKPGSLFLARSELMKFIFSFVD
jgi:hypothetical protein